MAEREYWLHTTRPANHPEHNLECIYRGFRGEGNVNFVEAFPFFLALQVLRENRYTGLFHQEAMQSTMSAIAQIIAGTIPHDSTVLEIGAGANPFGAVISPSQRLHILSDCTYFNLSPQDYMLLTAHDNVRVVALDGRKIPLSNNSVDIVLSIGSFDNLSVPQLLEAASESHRVLRLGGKVIFILDLGPGQGFCRDSAQVQGIYKKVLERQHINLDRKVKVSKRDNSDPNSIAIQAFHGLLDELLTFTITSLNLSAPLNYLQEGEFRQNLHRLLDSTLSKSAEAQEALSAVARTVSLVKRGRDEYRVNIRLSHLYEVLLGLKEECRSCTNAVLDGPDLDIDPIISHFSLNPFVQASCIENELNHLLTSAHIQTAFKRCSFRTVQDGWTLGSAVPLIEGVEDFQLWYLTGIKNITRVGINEFPQIVSRVKYIVLEKV
jgi:hypothetical protein